MMGTITIYAVGGICFMLGTIVGVFLSALCVAAGRADNTMENYLND